MLCCIYSRRKSTKYLIVILPRCTENGISASEFSHITVRLVHLHYYVQSAIKLLLQIRCYFFKPKCKLFWIKIQISKTYNFAHLSV